MDIKKGDTVIVICGKDKGKKGKVTEAMPKDEQVIVERVNTAKRHLKPTRTFQGGIIEKLMPINRAKVMLVCPSCGKPTRIKKKEQSRVCAKCGEMLDKVK